jgi:hypothetical protein
MAPSRMLADPYPFLLGHGCENANDCFLEGARRVEVLVRERPIVHSVAGQPPVRNAGAGGDASLSGGFPRLT